MKKWKQRLAWSVLFSMHLERSRGESNKFEGVICIDCGPACDGGAFGSYFGDLLGAGVRT